MCPGPEKRKHIHKEAIWQNFARSERHQYCPKEQKEERIGRMKMDGKKRKVFINGTFLSCATWGPTSSQNKDPHWAKIESWDPESVGPSKNVLD
ncbi:hypothetical protein CDAR_46501 [Caerostris darwini]|uniref:Uncharacterized protein n=1 Tax=Caerostris darwini TaxID=1538125 RepID=A0AAV4S5C6_9ARAC|nr:hypothetical protein CDAR_46501 [Caerostris darwini]